MLFVHIFKDSQRSRTVLVDGNHGFILKCTTLIHLVPNLVVTNLVVTNLVVTNLVVTNLISNGVSMTF